jgi:hypothetical protein
MKRFKIVLFSLGLVLLAINIFGLFKSMRSPDLYTGKNSGSFRKIKSGNL